MPPHGDPSPSVPHRSRRNDPAASSLDLDDETASTGRSISTIDAEDDSDLDGDLDDASHRISLQGPKIRFHSRAPWEIEDDILQGEESDNSSRSGTIGSKFKGKVSKADSLMRTFGKGTSIASRPSFESARSQASSRPSFVMTATNYSGSRGALYALVKASMSTSSLPASTAPSSAIPKNFFPRTGNYSHSDYYSIQAGGSSSGAVGNPREVVHTSLTYDAPMPPPPPSDVSRNHDHSATPPSPHSSQGRSSAEDFVHPYANPDLVVSYTPAPIMISPHQTAFGNISKSDSNSTVTDSISTRSAAISVMLTETSITSLTSRELTSGNLRVNGKEISSPIAVLRPNDIKAGSVHRNTKLSSLHPPSGRFNAACRNNPPHSPTVTLISLQEAQARERSRSATVHTIAAPFSKGCGDASQVPFPDVDDVASIAEGQHREVVGGISARARARSISAGAQAKNTLPTMVGGPQSHKPERRDSEHVLSPPASVSSGRVLKHKKSGFMRLFNGRGVDDEKERSPPPPVPPLSDAHAEHNLQIQSTTKTSNFTLPRVPVPSISPSIGPAVSSTTFSSTNGTSLEDAPDGKAASLQKRHPPPLYIVTGASGPCSHTEILEANILSRRAPISGLDLAPPPFHSLSTPQSAPPGTTDFQGLELRPISTSFSSHFVDIVVGPEEELQPDQCTPSSAASSGTALSPITSVSTRRSDDGPVGAAETPGERSLVMKALQDQMISAKKVLQRQIWELRGQVRDLKAEVEDLRAADDKEYCEVCGRGDPQKCDALSAEETRSKKVGVVNRPRARTGDAARFASGN
ncbi:hypothetical protein BS17DRAFT_762846 [Gyrodon lividus]|nr:hypothetical protein BS17DRAFT_762846 [Gyrodon lividus]